MLPRGAQNVSPPTQMISYAPVIAVTPIPTIFRINVM